MTTRLALMPQHVAAFSRAMSEKIRNESHLEEVLSKIVLRGPYAPQNWKFEKRAVRDGGGWTIGWLVRGTFDRLDRDTEQASRGSSREEFIPRDSTVNQVVKTCWVLVDLTTRHEAMESFTFDDARVFDPHHEIEDLADLNQRIQKRGTR